MTLTEFLRQLAAPRPDPFHRFVGDHRPIFIGDDRQWPMRRVECSGCGEVREVSWFLDPTQITGRCDHQQVAR